MYCAQKDSFDITINRQRGSKDLSRCSTIVHGGSNYFSWPQDKDLFDIPIISPPYGSMEAAEEARWSYHVTISSIH